MAPIYKIALVQMQPKEVDPEANFHTAASYIRQAAAQGAHLAVLPEYHLTNWVPENPAFVSASRASAAYVAQYQALARELHISIVPGTICEVSDVPAAADDDKSGGGSSAKIEMRNIAYFVAATTGAIAGRYQKKNLWHPERPHLTAVAPTHLADEPQHAAFATPLRHADGTTPVRAGLLICWDLAFPEAFRALIADGADVVLIPSCWHLTDVDARARARNPLCEKLFLESAVVARAYENTCAVVFVNTDGLSQVAVPVVGAVGGTIGIDAEEMRVVELDLELLRIAEENYKVREDMMREGWHYGYTLPRDDKGEGMRAN